MNKCEQILKLYWFAGTQNYCPAQMPGISLWRVGQVEAQWQSLVKVVFHVSGLCPWLTQSESFWFFQINLWSLTGKSISLRRCSILSLRSVLQFSFPSLASPYTVPLVFAFALEVSSSFLTPNSSSVYTA